LVAEVPLGLASASWELVYAIISPKS
jgi:hypothetical protein